MASREVRRSAAFLEQAYRLFPIEGSAEGRPSFRLFEQGPLRGAEMAFSLKFEAQREPVEGVAGIRYVMIPPTRFFGPIVVYGCLLADGAVELVSLIHDEGYGKLIDEDPVD